MRLTRHRRTTSQWPHRLAANGSGTHTPGDRRAVEGGGEGLNVDQGRGLTRRLHPWSRVLHDGGCLSPECLVSFPNLVGNRRLNGYEDGRLLADTVERCAEHLD